jgi:hypothetical protein
VNAPERVTDVIKHRVRGGMTYEAAVASVHDDIATGRTTLTQDFRVQYGDKR